MALFYNETYAASTRDSRCPHHLSLLFPQDHLHSISTDDFRKCRMEPANRQDQGVDVFFRMNKEFVVDGVRSHIIISASLVS